MGDGPQKRIHDALAIAQDVDGAHHKQWIIDQMVRALTGGGRDGQVTEEYRAWLAEYCSGEDGPETYEWNEGIEP